MKKLLLALLAFGAAVNSSYAQAGAWQRVAIGDSVTMDFPAEPAKHFLNGATSYGVYLDSALYSVAIMRNEQSQDIATEDLQDFYDGLMNGTIEKAHGTQTGPRTSFNVGNFSGIEIAFQPHDGKLKAPTTVRAVLINGTVYSQFFSATPTAAHSATRQRFFASFSPQQRPGPPIKSRAFRFGEMTGQLAFYGLLVAGLLYLVARPKKKGNPTA